MTCDIISTFSSDVSTPAGFDLLSSGIYDFLNGGLFSSDGSSSSRSGSFGDFGLGSGLFGSDSSGFRMAKRFGSNYRRQSNPNPKAEAQSLIDYINGLVTGCQCHSAGIAFGVIAWYFLFLWFQLRIGYFGVSPGSCHFGHCGSGFLVIGVPNLVKFPRRKRQIWKRRRGRGVGLRPRSSRLSSLSNR